MSIFDRILRAGEGKRMKRLMAVVPLINELEPLMEELDDGQLRAKTDEFRARLAAGETLDDLLVEAFAVVREAAKRTLGQRHFDVQLIGGMALHFGWIAEMQTGEGKTLVSTLPAYLNALEGKGVHVVTVNDYLSARDAAWMGKVYEALGLRVGRVGSEELDPARRRAAYLCDITYGTNTEFGFDYLRDNLATSLDEVVQRGHHFAIVDEVDSILIDEARTPLIISGPSEMSPELYYRFASIARTLRPDVDYEVDEEKKTVLLTDAGIERVERALGIENLYDVAHMGYLHQLTQALRAKHLFLRDRDYIVDRGEVKIVDEFTGRILEGRRWSDGLHQAVEAKERVRIQEENHTWATVTLQNYFRLYDKLAGMTGTAQTEAAEFASTYGLQVVQVPTNRPVQRVDHPDLVFKTEAGKFRAIVDEIEARAARGQPVLVGTTSVAKSEALSAMLTERGIAHAVLNAKYHAAEAEIIAQAGRFKAVTVATNMAGRGVDILLGGNPEGLARLAVREAGVDPESDEGLAVYEEARSHFEKLCSDEGARVRELGGLLVIGSERHEARRIDNQLRGRSGRQGDPGETRFFLSLEDDLMRLFAGGGVVSWVMQRALPEDQPIEAKAVTRAIERAQATVEARNADIRKDVLKYDQVLDEQRKVIYARRREILEGEDLSLLTRQTIERVVRRVADAYAPGSFSETWDLVGLVSEAHRVWNSAFEVEDLREATSRDQLVDSLVAEALELCEERERQLGVAASGVARLRSIERDVLLSVIDQLWREHLIDMDYLREGINLRAMGQQDPLVAWQQEGYEMFQELMRRIEDDYVRYLLRAEVSPSAPRLDLSAARYFGATDPQDVTYFDRLRQAQQLPTSGDGQG